MKMRLGIVQRVFVFLLLLLGSFFVFNTQKVNVLGQESDLNEWSKVKGGELTSSIEGLSLDEDSNYLFVSPDCNGCNLLFEDFIDIGFTPLEVKVFNVSESFVVKSFHRKVFEECTDLEVGLGTPLLYSGGECFAGFADIKNRIASEKISFNQEVISGEDFNIVSSFKNKLEREDYLKKNLLERVSDQTKVWEWILLGVIVVSGVAFLIYWILNRKSTDRKLKVVYSILQIFLFVLPTFYLGFKVNTAVNLGREYSSASSCLGTASNPAGSCGSWAELQAALAQNARETGVSTTRTRQAERFVEANGGLGSAQLNNLITQGNADTLAASERILAQANGDWTTAVNIVNGMNNGQFTISDNIITIAGQTFPLSVVQGVNPSAVYIQQVQNAVGSKCSRVADCQIDLQSYNRNVVRDNEGIIYQIDPVTGQLVATPVNTYVIDGYCESTIELSGAGTPRGDGIMCRCENVFGGYVYTVSTSGASCDAVCRVRFPCDDCNPPTIEPPPSPPPAGGPYCGDGKLGNTPGEECEYGDPSGVSCSWTLCDRGTCKCPEEDVPFCGDGIINNSFEECELGDPAGTKCKWNTCNHYTCKCVEPGCGDGVLDEGEKCERGDPEGVQCLWNVECNQLKCDCKVPKSPYCGDGILQEGEKCEVGDPLGVECNWRLCSKSTCTCPVPVDEYGNPVVPQTSSPTGSTPRMGILDDGYIVVIGAVILMLGLLFQPMVGIINRSYIKVYGHEITVGRYLDDRNRVNRREKVEKRFK